MNPHYARASEVHNEEGRSIGWEGRCTCGWVGQFRAYKYVAQDDAAKHADKAAVLEDES